jgi:hypothetical protein
MPHVRIIRPCISNPSPTGIHLPPSSLRQSYRQDGKVQKRILCNLSNWSAAQIDGPRGVLRGGTVIPADRDTLTVSRSLPHGHVAAALGTLRKIGRDRILGPAGNRCHDLIVGRILDPRSRLQARRRARPLPGQGHFQPG